MIIYSVANTSEYISLTDPASVRQVIQALKNEGLIRRNCRYASYSLAYMGLGSEGTGIAVMKGGKLAFTLWPEDSQFGAQQNTSAIR
jgi:hypothetical protein